MPLNIDAQDLVKEIFTKLFKLLGAASCDLVGSGGEDERVGVKIGATVADPYKSN